VVYNYTIYDIHLQHASRLHNTNRIAKFSQTITMLAKNMFLVFALSAIGLAQDVDDNDVPQQCRSVCASVVTLSNTCDRQNNDNDAGYLNCVCTSQDASSQIPLCEACVAANDNDGRDNGTNFNCLNLAPILTAIRCQRPLAILQFHNNEL
jgi:hypothetical protein